MKTKHTIYFQLIPAGSALVAPGDRLLKKEYAFSPGMAWIAGGIILLSRIPGSQTRKKRVKEDVGR